MQGFSSLQLSTAAAAPPAVTKLKYLLYPGSRPPVPRESYRLTELRLFNSLVSEGTIEFSPQLSINVSSVKVTLTFWVTNAPILFLADRIRIKLILTRCHR